jgi:hypothetical protein
MSEGWFKLDAALAQCLLVLLAIGLYGWLGPVGLFAILLWVVPIIVAIELGKSRDRKGWMWGLFLGWIGVLILAIMRPIRQPLADRRHP